MKGVEVALADPIDPICPEDDRPAVKDLIVEHGEKIAKIKSALIDHPLYEEDKHDDLWILRYWLSHKKSKAGAEEEDGGKDKARKGKQDKNIGYAPT